MGERKNKLAIEAKAQMRIQDKAFSFPDVAMPPEQQFILDGLVQAAMHQRQLLAQAEQRCTNYIIDCAKILVRNSPRYMWEPEKRVFTMNPNYAEPEKPNA